MPIVILGQSALHQEARSAGPGLYPMGLEKQTQGIIQDEASRPLLLQLEQWQLTEPGAPEERRQQEERRAIAERERAEQRRQQEAREAERQEAERRHQQNRRFWLGKTSKTTFQISNISTSILTRTALVPHVIRLTKVYWFLMTTHSTRPHMIWIYVLRPICSSCRTFVPSYPRTTDYSASILVVVSPIESSIILLRRWADSHLSLRRHRPWFEQHVFG